MTPLNVLYVEDNEADLDITRLQLERVSPGQFRFTSAADLKTAIPALKHGRFDVVLADLNLPDSKGVDTIRALLAAGCKAPIIAFTGNLDERHGIDAVKAGATDFVTKGITDWTTLSNRIAFAAQRGASVVPSEALEQVIAERTAALTKTLHDLQATNRDLEAFSYTISHDLRAPLRNINGLSKILQLTLGESLPKEAKEMLERLAGEVVRGGKLIDAILSLSRLGTVGLTPGDVDVSAAATAVCQALQANDPSRTVEWTVEPDLHALADAGLLRLLLENLLGNAWKFTGHTEAARISVAREAGGFRIEDNGAGFDMAHARELFQPFHRLHAADDFEGTGIGLATVSRIVARHGGRVWAESTPGRGATFRVTFPDAASSNPAPAFSPHERWAANGHTR